MERPVNDRPDFMLLGYVEAARFEGGQPFVSLGMKRSHLNRMNNANSITRGSDRVEERVSALLRAIHSQDSRGNHVRVPDEV